MKAAALDRNGRLICLGDILTMRYGNGTQSVRVREITSRGGLKLDRLYSEGANRPGWRASKTTVSPTDKRFV